jgi:hypothetical protein
MNQLCRRKKALRRTRRMPRTDITYQNRQSFLPWFGFARNPQSVEAREEASLNRWLTYRNYSSQSRSPNAVSE